MRSDISTLQLFFCRLHTDLFFRISYYTVTTTTERRKTAGKYGKKVTERIIITTTTTTTAGGGGGSSNNHSINTAEIFSWKLPNSIFIKTYLSFKVK
jgi:hypothetical protein